MALKIVPVKRAPTSAQGTPVGGAPADASSAEVAPADGAAAGQVGDADAQQAARVDVDTPSLTGSLAASEGARLLMHLFSEERTGRLVLDAGPSVAGTLYMLRGEPAHAALADSSARIEARLKARGVLKDLTAAPTAVRARHALAALCRRSDPVSVLEALREEVRMCTVALVGATSGSWSFVDDEPSLDFVPLTQLNPFGLILDARRRGMAPDQLLALADLGPLYVVPAHGLEVVTARLTGFTGGVDLAQHADGAHTVKEVLAELRLDPMMGGLVLQSLVDAGVARLSSTRVPARRGTNPRARAPAAVVVSDAHKLSALGSTAGASGLELLSLYLEVKPERDDTAVLGAEGSAGIAALERGYQNRLAELDARAIPDGPHRPLLLARAEELRSKIERAYQRRVAARPRTKTTSAYQILDRIGVGGMAEVFRGVPADDPTHFIAIKVVLPALRSDARFSQMFLEEARLARRIQHRNVVRVLSVGRGRDDLYLAMEYVDGLDFAELLRRAIDRGHKTRIDVVCRVIAEACAGLHAAHTAHDRAGAISPILHRDVSPQNILVSRTGEVKLSDFGIAKAMDGGADEPKGSVRGKIPYLAPELLRGEPASVQSDVYAMAMTMYAALGRLPFQRRDPVETMRAILTEPLPPLSRVAPGVPPILDAILLSSAAREPAERHASAQQLQLEIEEILTLLPPVDVAAWARPLAGDRTDPGAPSRPITSVRSSTGLTGAVGSDEVTVPGAQPPRLSPPEPSAEGGDIDVDVDDL